MNNKDKMLQLVLSDEKLISFYNYNPKDYPTVSLALKSDNPVVVVVAKIIDRVSWNTDSSSNKELYSEIFQYLNQNIQ